MLSSRPLTRALRSSVPTAIRSSAARYYSSAPSNSPSEAGMADKDQVKAEQAAKDPKKMANLDKKRDEQEKDSATNATPGVKGNSGRQDEPLGGIIGNKASG